MHSNRTKKNKHISVTNGLKIQCNAMQLVQKHMLVLRRY